MKVAAGPSEEHIHMEGTHPLRMLESEEKLGLPAAASPTGICEGPFSKSIHTYFQKLKFHSRGRGRKMPSLS